MFIKSFSSGPLDTNGYVVGDGEVFLIDAPLDSLPLYQKILKDHFLLPKALLLTHSHLDHTADAKAIAEAFSVPIYIHPLDAPNLKRPGADGLPVFIPAPPVEPHHLFREGEKLRVGNVEVEVIHTPGHSPGGVSFYIESEKVLFSGDTLFRGTIGNLSFPTAQPEKMWESLKKLSILPKDVVVYPGHGPATKIGAEGFLSDAKRYFS